MGKVNIKQLNVAPASGYVIGSGAGGVPIWKLEVASVAWNQITGNQALVNLSGFTNDSGFITLGSLSAGTGISYNNLTGVITNSAPDQTVVLTQGTGITITGTYPNFTIASNGNQTITLSGDVTGLGTTGIVTTIANNAVSNAKFRQSVGRSIVGRSAGTTGDVADIIGSEGQVLTVASGLVQFGVIGLGAITGTANQVVYASGSGFLTQSANFTYNGTDFSVNSGTINASTGYKLNGAAALGQYLRGNGTNFVSSALTASDLAANSITDGLIRQSAGLSVIGRSANSTGNVADITAGTDLHVLRRSGTSIGFGLLTLGSMSATNNQVVYGASGVLAQSSVLQFDGSNLGLGGTSATTKFNITDTILAGSGSLTGSALNINQTWNTSGSPTMILANATNTASGTNTRVIDLQVGGTTAFRVDKFGYAVFGVSGGFYPAGATGAYGSLANTNLGFYNATATNDALFGSFGFTGANITGTSGTYNLTILKRTFAPTSGTALYHDLAITPTINQTGGANGITRGVYINPTLTAAADWRVFESTAGRVIIGGATGALTVGSGSFTTANGVINATTGYRVNNAATSGSTLMGNGTNFVPATRAQFLGYKEYVALLSQSGTDAPVATVLYNDLGGTVVWSYIGAGDYLATLSGAFTVNKTVTIPQNAQIDAFSANDVFMAVTSPSVNTVSISISSFGLLSDGFLNGVYLTIRVYN